MGLLRDSGANVTQNGLLGFLTLSKITNSRLLKTERVCTRYF